MAKHIVRLMKRVILSGILVAAFLSISLTQSTVLAQGVCPPGSKVGSSTSSAVPTNVTSPPAASGATATPSGGGTGQIAFIADSKAIEVMDADGSNLRVIANGLNLVGGFEWSPDGQQMVYGSGSYNDSAIYVMNADGSDVRRLSPELGAVTDPAFSPDGQQIAFVATRGGGSDIWIMDTAGKKIQPLTQDQDSLIESDPVWSPDGQQIAFAAHADANGFEYAIMIMDVDGRNQHCLTTSSEPAWDLNYPAWSPDGRRIALDAYNADSSPTERDIFLMNPDGSNLLNLTNNDKDETMAGWSPDGQQIAFIQSQWVKDKKNYVQYSDLFVMNADGSNMRQLTVNGSNSYPAWRPAIVGEDTLQSLPTVVP